MPPKPKSPKPSKATPVKPKTVAVKKPAAAPKKAVKPERTDVFVSYSHADKKWLTELQTHLKPLGRDHGINIWEDTRLQSGDSWRTEIDNALAKSRVAILLVSARFMASDFITKNELPPLLEAAEKEGVIILPVIIGKVEAFFDHKIGKIQAVNDPLKPLNKLSEGDVDEELSKLYRRIYKIFAAPTSNVANSTKSKSIAPVILKEPSPQKRKASAAQLQGTKKTNTSTNRVSSNALLVTRTGEWLVIPVIQGVVNDDIRLDLRVTTSVQRAFLTSLRQQNSLNSIVYRSQTYFCKSQDIQMKTVGNQEIWQVQGALKVSNRQANITNGYMITAQQAELHARVLLLNEKPSNNQPSSIYFYPTLPNGGESPLPILYKQLNQQALAFKQNAALIMTWFLQVNNVVHHIHKLSFTLKANTLSVQFEGERDSLYHNDERQIIKFKGSINLAEPTVQKTVKLITQT